MEERALEEDKGKRELGTIANSLTEVTYQRRGKTLKGGGKGKAKVVATTPECHNLEEIDGDIIMSLQLLLGQALPEE